MSHSGNTAKEQLFELVERAELCYRVAEGEKSRLAVELMGNDLQDVGQQRVTGRIL